MTPRWRALGAVLLIGTLTACTSGRSTEAAHTSSSISTTPAASPAPTSTPAPISATASPAPTAQATPVPTPTPTKAVAAGAPVIVIDPGHSVTIHAIDPATGLDVSDYENEPEMRDVFSVAQLVQAQLTAAGGYRVILTKTSLDAPTSLGTRAAIANNAHAALALSIHDQAGSSGGIGFTQGNNTVYYQSVGDYRATPSGKKVYFTNAALAATSKKYAQIFQAKRAAAQGSKITLLGDTGYDLGSRGLPAGDIWLVQLLSQVPWIYNEAGGNSSGQVGLSSADKQRYAAGLVAAVEACVPING